MQKIEQTKTVHIDQCTPIKVIEKPAKAGPITLAICQTELLQVALGYTFLGTSKDNSEKWS
jgi:TPP-dependent trihydroxycyclohexane-1,2-dione (THcHDO) dehydratase